MSTLVFDDYANNTSWTSTFTGTVVVEVWGAGGGGATYGRTTGSHGAGGGGGGAYSVSTVNVVKDTQYTMVVGQGGAGATSNNSNGTPGTYSSFNNNEVWARGGNAGNRSGAAGNGGNTSGAGATKYAGGNGGQNNGALGGGGGAGAGNAAKGNDAVLEVGGEGGGDGGTGGTGGRENESGLSGTTPGGGGGGAGNNSGTTVKAGGSGANGMVRLTYYAPIEPQRTTSIAILGVALAFVAAAATLNVQASESITLVEPTPIVQRAAPVEDGGNIIDWDGVYIVDYSANNLIEYGAPLIIDKTDPIAVTDTPTVQVPDQVVLLPTQYDPISITDTPTGELSEQPVLTADKSDPISITDTPTVEVPAQVDLLPAGSDPIAVVTDASTAVPEQPNLEPVGTEDISLLDVPTYEGETAPDVDFDASPDSVSITELIGRHISTQFPLEPASYDDIAITGVPNAGLPSTADLEPDVYDPVSVDGPASAELVDPTAIPPHGYEQLYVEGIATASVVAQPDLGVLASDPIVLDATPEGEIYDQPGLLPDRYETIAIAGAVSVGISAQPTLEAPASDPISIVDDPGVEEISGATLTPQGQELVAISDVPRPSLRGHLIDWDFNYIVDYSGVYIAEYGEAEVNKPEFVHISEEVITQLSGLMYDIFPHGYEAISIVGVPTVDLGPLRVNVFDTIHVGEGAFDWNIPAVPQDISITDLASASLQQSLITNRSDPIAVVTTPTVSVSEQTAIEPSGVETIALLDIGAGYSAYQADVYDPIALVDTGGASVSEQPVLEVADVYEAISLSDTGESSEPLAPPVEFIGYDAIYIGAYYESEIPARSTLSADASPETILCEDSAEAFLNAAGTWYIWDALETVSVSDSVLDVIIALIVDVNDPISVVDTPTPILVSGISRSDSITTLDSPSVLVVAQPALTPSPIDQITVITTAAWDKNVRTIDVHDDICFSDYASKIIQSIAFEPLEKFFALPVRTHLIARQDRFTFDALQITFSFVSIPKVGRKDTAMDFDIGIIPINANSSLWGPFEFNFENVLPDSSGDPIVSVAVSSSLAGLDTTNLLIGATPSLTSPKVDVKFSYPGSALIGKHALKFVVALASGATTAFNFGYVEVT